MLFGAIRRGKTINDGTRMATSTLLAIMGRMAAYTGQQITWDQALNSQESIGPPSGKIDWAGSFEPPPIARPGQTKFI